MPDIGPTELIIILLVVLLLFGGTRLADLGGSLGKGIREFRRNIRDEDAEADEPATSAGDVASVAAPNLVGCPRCQAENPASARFCAECGSPLAADTVEPRVDS